MHESRPFMPPFVGTEAERKALAAYIAGDLHGKEVKEAEKVVSGKSVFEGNCASCHEAGELIASMQGQSPEEISEALGRLNEISEEMVPFAGSEEERRMLSLFLHGSEEQTVAAPAVDGAEVFAGHCSACHAPEDMAGPIAGKGRKELADMLGRLNELNEEMQPFAGSAEEKVALSVYLETLAGGAK